jgi:hypothetical protein
MLASSIISVLYFNTEMSPVKPALGIRVKIFYTTAMAKRARKRRVGRPPKKVGKMDSHVHLKLTNDRKKQWQNAAERQLPPMDLSEWIRRVCDAAADE